MPAPQTSSLPMGARRSANAFPSARTHSSFPVFLRDRGGRASCPEKSWLKHKTVSVFRHQPACSPIDLHFRFLRCFAKNGATVRPLGLIDSLRPHTARGQTAV